MVSEEGIEKALEDIETLKKDIADLRQEHVAMATQLLQVWRELTKARIAICTDATRDIIVAQLPSLSHLLNQLFADAAASNATVNQSSNPWTIAHEFFKKWSTIMQQSGAKTVTY